jgi:hypothetical protein
VVHRYSTCRYFCPFRGKNMYQKFSVQVYDEFLPLLIIDYF